MRSRFFGHFYFRIELLTSISYFPVQGWVKYIFQLLRIPSRITLCFVMILGSKSDPESPVSKKTRILLFEYLIYSLHFVFKISTTMFWLHTGVQIFCLTKWRRSFREMSLIFSSDFFLLDNWSQILKTSKISTAAYEFWIFIRNSAKSSCPFKCWDYAAQFFVNLFNNLFFQNILPVFRRLPRAIRPLSGTVRPPEIRPNP